MDYPFESLYFFMKGAKVKHRITIFESLEERNSSYTDLIEVLREEIYDFYCKLDLYHHYQFNQHLFYFIYMSDEYMTILELSFEFCVDSKTIQKFIKRTDDFVQTMIKKNEKYFPLTFLL